MSTWSTLKKRWWAEELLLDKIFAGIAITLGALVTAVASLNPATLIQWGLKAILPAMPLLFVVGLLLISATILFHWLRITSKSNEANEIAFRWGELGYKRWLALAGMVFGIALLLFASFPAAFGAPAVWLVNVMLQGSFGVKALLMGAGGLLIAGGGFWQIHALSQLGKKSEQTYFDRVSSLQDLTDGDSLKDVLGTQRQNAGSKALFAAFTFGVVIPALLIVFAWSPASPFSAVFLAGHAVAGMTVKTLIGAFGVGLMPVAWGFYAGVVFLQGSKEVAEPKSVERKPITGTRSENTGESPRDGANLNAAEHVARLDSKTVVKPPKGKAGRVVTEGEKPKKRAKEKKEKPLVGESATLSDSDVDKLTRGDASAQRNVFDTGVANTGSFRAPRKEKPPAAPAAKKQRGLFDDSDDEDLLFNAKGGLKKPVTRASNNLFGDEPDSRKSSEASAGSLFS